MIDQPTTDRDTLWAALMREAEPDPKGGHLMWKGSRNNGVPVVSIPGRGTIRASRIAIECTTGEAVPKGIHVIPTCGLFFCIAPGHLKVGRQPSARRRATGRQAA